LDIDALITAGESETLEFKASFGKDVIVSLAAFANAKGGKVVVGADDKGRPVGMDVGPETMQRYLNEIKVATYPQIIPRIEYCKSKGKSLVVFEITEYPIKPVAYKNRY
jgi:ATP-dependent DNA helicase RecG